MEGNLHARAVMCGTARDAGLFANLALQRSLQETQWRARRI
jgi:hypothetical protein